MSAPVFAGSGTTTTDGTEQTLVDLSSATTPGIYKLVFDTRNMASGNTTILRVYKKAKVGGTLSLLSETTYTDAQDPPLKEIDGLTCALGIELKITLERTAGTDRAYDWFLESF